MSLVNSAAIGMQATQEAIEKLRSTVKGSVITPADADYDAIRTPLSNEVVRRPGLIVRPVDAVDVSRAVVFARENGLELAVRGGGHSLSGYSTSEGGLVIDLSSMKRIEINAEERTAWAEGGVTAGEYTLEAAKFGLATGFGDTASVGIGGLTTGGGIGYLVRKHGLTIDNLLAARVVTADGQIRYVDGETHPDLFWAIRGGGGNFGVVTQFKFRLHPVDTIVGGLLILPAKREVIAEYAALSEAAPDELSSIVNIMPLPPMPFIPAEYHGQVAMLAMLVYAGDVEEGLRVVEPFRKLAEPLVDMLGPIPYPAVYIGDEFGAPPATAVRSKFMDKVDERAAQIMLDHLHASNSPLRIAQVRVLGGAMARVPADATAFAHRSGRVMVTFLDIYENRDEAAIHEAWVSSAIAALGEDSGSVYVNFVGHEDEARLHDAYPQATLERLAAVKAKYDPTNLFRRNHNIAPKTA